MMSKSNVKKVFTILAGVLFVFSCSLPVPTELPSASSAPASPSGAVSQPGATPPTEQVSPTPTERSFVLPDGRLLFAFLPTSELLPNTDKSFYHYSWLRLPDMSVEANPHTNLVGEYPVVDEIVVPSPDLSHLVVGRTTYKLWTDNSLALSSTSVLLANPDDDEVAQIGQPTVDYINNNDGIGDNISWSANSQVFAFTYQAGWGRLEEENHLNVYDLPTGVLKTLSLRTFQPFGFTLSPDGKQIAFSDQSGLSLINADGSNQLLITEDWIGSNLVWHPDGKRIFFVGHDPVLGIYSVDVSTGASTQLTSKCDDPAYLKLFLGAGSVKFGGT